MKTFWILLASAGMVGLSHWLCQQDIARTRNVAATQALTVLRGSATDDQLQALRTDLDSEMEVREDQVNIIGMHLDDNAAKITGLESSKDAHDGDISDLEARISNLQSELDVLTEWKEELEFRVRFRR